MAPLHPACHCLLAASLMLCFRFAKAFSNEACIRTKFLGTRPPESTRPFAHFTRSFSTTSNNNNAQKGKKAKNTGGLRRLPVVKSPVELMNKAARDAQRVKADTYVEFGLRFYSCVSCLANVFLSC